MARWRKRKNKKSGNARKQEGNEKAGATRDTIRESWREQETRVSREMHPPGDQRERKYLGAGHPVDGDKRYSS